MARAATRPKGNAPVVTQNVGFVRKEVRDRQREYETIRDCIEGETKIKHRQTRYLPKPNSADTSAENEARYRSYLERAVFYNATARTLAGLLGEIYAINPVIEVPVELEPFIQDASGSGITLIQQSISAAHNVLAYSRSGILVDFPHRETPASIAELRAGEIKPKLTVYQPWQVINWRTITKNSRTILSLVVLEEEYEKEDDGFETKTEKQFRVLRLDASGEYAVEIWRTGSTYSMAPDETFKPLDAAGNPFDEIPFHFIGATNNDDKVDRPLMYDLASLNIGHYRNSADYEESAYICGQPLYYFAGLTKDWVKDVLKGRVETGARAAVALPEKGTAGILQPKENTMPLEAMKQKERQMVALGAKLVEQRQVQRTATESTMDQRTENSILSTAANNVSDAFQWALQIAAKFMGAATDKLKFRCNTEFAVQKMSPEDQQQLVTAWQAGIVMFEEAREGLRKSGIATRPDEVAKTALAKEAEERLEREIKVIEAKRPPAAPANNNANNAE